MLSAVQSGVAKIARYTDLPRKCTRLVGRCAAIFLIGCMAAGCSLSIPGFGLSNTKDSESAVVTTGALTAAVPAKATAGGFRLEDHLGPEDLRRATGAMALALDPQGNGSPVGWDNTESKSGGRITPVGGPFLREDEVCRAFLTEVKTLMDSHNLQGTACRPSGGEWSIKDLKPWKQQG